MRSVRWVAKNARRVRSLSNTPYFFLTPAILRETELKKPSKWLVERGGVLSRSVAGTMPVSRGMDRYPAQSAGPHSRPDIAR